MKYIKIYFAVVLLYVTLFAFTVVVQLDYEEHFSGAARDYYRFETLSPWVKAAVVIQYVIEFPLGVLRRGEGGASLLLFFSNSLLAATTIVALLYFKRRKNEGGR